MDLCSTKHTCSNSACQMFADKWVVLSNTSIKKLYQINNDKGNWQNIQNRQMSDHSRGVSTGVESNAGPYWSTLCYGSLLSCAALRSQCRGIRCGDSGLTKYGYVNTHIWDFSLIFHLFIISFAFWIKLITLQYHSCLITVSAYWRKYFICRDQYYWHGAVQLSRYMHMPPSLYYSFENYSSNLSRCGFQRNIVTSTDLTHWHLFIACSDHITLFSMRFEANTCCYYDNTNSCGVLHTMNKCTFWYIST